MSAEQATADRIWRDYVAESSYDWEYAFACATAYLQSYMRDSGNPQPYRDTLRRIYGERRMIVNPQTIKDVEVPGPG